MLEEIDFMYVNKHQEGLRDMLTMETMFVSRFYVYDTLPNINWSQSGLLTFQHVHIGVVTIA